MSDTWKQQLDGRSSRNAAEHQARQDEVATQPALPPRTIEVNQADLLPGQEWPVLRIRQSPPKLRAERPDYQHRAVENWHHYITLSNETTLILEQKKNAAKKWSKRGLLMKQACVVGRLKRMRQVALHIAFQQVIQHTSSRPRINLELFLKFMEHFEPTTRKPYFTTFYCKEGSTVVRETYSSCLHSRKCSTNDWNRSSYPTTSAPPAQEQRPTITLCSAAQRQQVVHPDQQAAYDKALRMAQEAKFNIIEKDPNQKRISQVKLPKDIDWAQSMSSFGHSFQVYPTSGKPESEFRELRKKIPLLTEDVFYELFHSYQASTIEVVNPMMIVVWTKDWPDAAKFQYLLQILEVTVKDYIPKWQIAVEQDDDFPTMILKLRYPSTVWDGHPVLGFMAETDFKDGQGNYLTEVSFADFNPMWSFPPTSVKSNYDNITFGMDPSHLRSDPHIQRML